MKPEVLRSLLYSATSAPWKASGEGFQTICGPEEFQYVADDIDGVGEEDAALIVALRNLAPLLVDLWEAAEDCCVKGDAHADDLLRGGDYLASQDALEDSEGRLSKTVYALREAKP